MGNKNSKLEKISFYNNLYIDYLDDCPICFNKTNFIIYSSYCKHSFCYDCINNWFKFTKNKKLKFTCPICRSKLNELLYYNNKINYVNISNNLLIIKNS